METVVMVAIVGTLLVILPLIAFEKAGKAQKESEEKE